MILAAMKPLWVCVIIALSIPTFAQKPDTFTVLRDIIERGVAPQEPVRQMLRAHLPAWTKPQVDHKGNLIVKFGAGAEHLYFVGHLDEVAYVVTAINNDGSLTESRTARPLL
jgi:hypothetical protein